MIRLLRGRWALLAWLSIVACTSGEQQAAVIDTLPSGQITVTNHAPSGWADTNGWKIVKVSERTFKFGELGAMERPNSPALFADGGVVVVNQRPVFISRFSPTLEPLGQFSREGEGPGEFRGPELFVARDSIYVVDNQRSVLAAFDRNGILGRETLLPCCVNDMPVVDTAGRFAIGGPFTNPRTAIRWWSLDGSRFVDSVTLPPGPEPIVIAPCSFQLPYQAERMAAAGPNGLTWWGVSDADRFVLTRRGTDTILVTTSDRPRVPVTDANLAYIFDDTTFFAKQCGAALTTRRGDVPKLRPAFSDLHVDSQGTLWVQRPKSTFDVYAPDGRWLGVVANPISGNENWYWRGDRIASVETRDDGSFVLRVYRVERR